MISNPLVIKNIEAFFHYYEYQFDITRIISLYNKSMFSQELIDQLSKYIIRPHRQIYGLDKLGPKKTIIKSINQDCYIQIHRHQCTILSANKKIQLSIFQPHFHSYSLISSTYHHVSHNSGLPIPPQININIQNKTQITIFLHTNSGSRLQGLEYSKHLLQYGELVCLFDYSGSGVSEGEFVTMGVNQSVDLANVIQYLKEKFNIEKVNLWGRSMGAVTAVLYSSKYPKNIRKMVLDSPFCDFRQLVKQIVSSRTCLPQFLFGTILLKIEEHLKKKLSINMLDIDLRNEIIKPGMDKIPIFFLLSKDDQLVLPTHVQTLYQMHQGYKKIIYLQGSHNKPRPTQIRQQCAQFLCNKINNVSSLKVIDTLKKPSIASFNRKYSYDTNTTQIKSKISNTTFLLNTCQSAPSTEQPINNFNNQQKFGNKQTFLINLLKKNKPDTQLSSTLSTPRDDLSTNKYNNAKISLSQLKKAQTINIQPITSSKYAKGAHQFKKQSKTTMAIQYKNKIKDQINRM